jgi:hypothetical protein
LRELTEEDVKELELKVAFDRRLLRRLGNDIVREGNRLSCASKHNQSFWESPAAVMVEVIPENAVNRKAERICT